jgi:putative ABC transport system substrate-binding protein
VPPALAIQAVDPVQSGLVTSLNRPGGNITGIAALTIELDPKRLELLHQLTPSNGPFGVLLNPSRPDTQIQVAGIWLSSRGRNDSLKKLDRSVIERSYSRRRGGSCNTGLRGLMVAGDSKADARNK